MENFNKIGGEPRNLPYLAHQDNNEYLSNVEGTLINISYATGYSLRKMEAGNKLYDRKEIGN